MKTETLEQEMHIKALLWKSMLQQTEEQLERIQKKIEKSKCNLNAIDSEDTLEAFTSRSTHSSEKVEQLKNRVSTFENKLTLIHKCDTSQCDVAFFEEADAISATIDSCCKNVTILSSEISQYTNSKLSDKKNQN